MILKLLKHHIMMHKKILLWVLTPIVLYMFWMQTMSPLLADLTGIGNYFLKPNDLKVWSSVYSISGFLTDFWFSFMSVAVVLVITMVFVYLSLISETSSGRMSYWMTLPTTRTQVIISKLLFNISIAVFLWLVLFIFTSFGSIAAIDNDQYYGYMLSEFILFLIHIILLITIIFFIGVLCLSNKLAYWISTSIFILYVSITGYVTWIASMGDGETVFQIICKYISIGSLFTSVLEFDINEITNDPTINHDGNTYYVLPKLPIDTTKLIITSIIQPILIGGLIVGQTEIFKRKNI